MKENLQNTLGERKILTVLRRICSEFVEAQSKHINNELNFTNILFFLQNVRKQSIETVKYYRYNNIIKNIIGGFSYVNDAS